MTRSKFSNEEPNSFPNLHELSLSHCEQLNEKVFEHLSKNNHLVCQLKELDAGGMSEIISSSPSALNNICQLKGLRRLYGMVSVDEQILQRLKNRDVVY